jgi:hypothetical protein
LKSCPKVEKEGGAPVFHSAILIPHSDGRISLTPANQSK